MTTPAEDDRTELQDLMTGARGTGGRRLPGDFPDALAPGTRLHEFEIVSVIGQGGFGIVYLAYDLTLDRRVAIKEYLPGSLATRTAAMTVALRSRRHAGTFEAGLRSFVNEARLLAQFDHPSLLKVHRFWKAHGTAYMAMPYYAGVTLAAQLARAPDRPGEARLRALLDPLLDALALMHAARCWHRDISPDNILVLPDGTPLLLDFGAARRVIGDMTQALTVILKTGYAPVEQYGEMPDLSQGPWTDLYALGSVVEFAITGRTPPQAVTRFVADRREPLAVGAAGRYSDGFLRAIDRSLAVLPKDRPQSVAEMRALLAVAPGPAAAAAVTTRPQPRGVAVGAAAAVLAALAVLAGRSWVEGPRGSGAADANAPVAAQASQAVVTVVPPPVRSPVPSPVPSASPTEPAPTQPAPTQTAATEIQATIPTTPAAPAAPPLPVIVAAPRRHGAAPVGGETPQPALRLPRKKLPDARCADIIERVSLGEPLSDAERAILTRECGP